MSEFDEPGNEARPTEVPPPADPGPYPHDAASPWSRPVEQGPVEPGLSAAPEGNAESSRHTVVYPHGVDQPAYGPPYGATAPVTGGYQGAAAGPSPLWAGAGPAVATAERPRRARSAFIGTALLAAVVGAGVGAGTVAIVGTGNSGTAAIVTTTQTAQPASGSGTVSSAAARITPSVVTLQVTGSQESGTGSGVIIRSDGYILTNDHVVSVAAGGGTITAQTADGRSAKATIVGRDTSDDLAVVKVSGLTNLTAATFADSSKLVVGQTVVAVGAPLGLSDTVTSGIVSATARTVRSGDQDQAVFAAVQTDAAINPGNSGGALVDLNGNVVGINAAIATASSSGVTIPGQATTQSGSIGIGFAIPANEATRIAGQLIGTGKATHALLGVTVNENTTAVGATIASVTADGPGAAAGLKTGDVVTAVSGTHIDTGDDLIAIVRNHAPGDTISITYTRGGSSHTTTAKLGTSSS